MSTQPNINNPAQGIQAIWESLNIQLTSTNPIIALPETIFLSWNSTQVAFLLQAYYGHTGQVGMFVRDGSMINRIFLGPATYFLHQALHPITAIQPGVIPPTVNNIPVLLNYITARPQNQTQLATMPPYIKLQHSTDLPQEFLLHIAYGQGVPRSALARTVARRPLNSPRQTLSFQVASTYTSLCNRSQYGQVVGTIGRSRTVTFPLSDWAQSRVGVENLASNPDHLDAPQDFGDFSLDDGYFRTQLLDYAILNIPEPSHDIGKELGWIPNGATEYLKSYEWLTSNPRRLLC